MKPSQLTSEQKRDIIAKAADDKKANYVTELDLRGKTLIADFFLICSGTSNIHIRSIADGIVEEMEKNGIRQHRSEGYSEATWIVVDYGDVIVHVMSEDERDRYKLESLWTREVKLDASGQTILSASSKKTKEDDDAEDSAFDDPSDLEHIDDDFGDAEIHEANDADSGR